ncbi:MAG: hypothetical protein NTW06_02905, partial [Candidatus Falkowbacteria bacterium]|nr:hypothetical protein [Candidatus Falkowbacteria bacterium]
VNPKLRREAYIPLEKNLLRKSLGLYSQIIHGDLNNSNFVWKGNSPKIIDTDNLCFSKRIAEFIPVLFFKGNFERPEYLKGSVKKLVESYDHFVNKKLSDLEKAILGRILGLSLVKLYTIYNVRRNSLDETFEKQIVDNLKLIGEDSNVH